MADTSIEWTDKVWNCVRGCSLVSLGCKFCYAMMVAYRFSGPGQPYEGLVRMGANGPVWTGRIREVPAKLADPLKWKKPQRIFVNSMSDLFHEDVSDEFVAAVFGVMAMCPQHTFQILTKRADRLPKWFAWLKAEYDGPCDQNAVLQVACGPFLPPDKYDEQFEDMLDAEWPLPNVHLGVSAEDQASYDLRRPFVDSELAAVMWWSLEPLLGPIDLKLGEYRNLPGWIVVGGESGSMARSCDIDWIRNIVAQCRAYGISVFVKQLGKMPRISTSEAAGCRRKGKPGNWFLNLRDSHGGDWSEWPEDLRVRKFPAARSEVAR